MAVAEGSKIEEFAMHACLITLGIILTSQVADPTGRYGLATPPASSESAAAQAATYPSSQQTPADTSTVASGENPLRPSLPASTQPTGASQPATSSQLGTASQPPTTRPPASSAPTGRLTKVVKPIDLLKNLVKPSVQQPLAGEPLSLAEAVNGSRSREVQTRRVRLYWDLSRLVSDYRLAVREEAELTSQHNGLSQPEAHWTTAISAANARRQVALNAARAAQLQLQRELGRSVDAPLPLPSDLPHCGAYETKYQQIFQGRTSREAQQLADLLPLRHQQLSQRAADTTAAMQWYKLVSQQRGAQSDTRLLLKAYEQLALQRQMFITSAYDYNENIARYTALAVPQQVGTVRLVSMLIQSPNTPNTNWQPGAIQRASAEESGGKSAVAGRYQPRTFAEGNGRSETRRIGTDGQPDEHSIVVDPVQKAE